MMSLGTLDEPVEGKRGRRVWMLVVVVVLLAGVFVVQAAVGAGSGKVFSVALDPPVLVGGCHGATTAGGGGTVLPVAVVRGHGEVVMYVAVCIDGQGPWPFIVDSGASSSVIASALAKQLGLTKSGTVNHYGGVGCDVSSQGAAVQAWSMAGLTLDPQPLQVQPLAGMGGVGQPDGLLGADVLSRFGAVQFNYQDSTLVVAGPEGPVSNQVGGLPVQAPSTPLPVAVAKAGPSTQVSLTVLSGPGYAMALTRVDFPGDPNWQFLVDTGSSRSAINKATVASNFSGTGTSEQAGSVCASVTVPLVESGEWTLPDTYVAQKLALPPTQIAEVDLGGAGAAVNGLLGSDVLSRYGYATIDFSGSRMVLGPRIS